MSSEQERKRGRPRTVLSPEQIKEHKRIANKKYYQSIRNKLQQLQNQS